MKKKNQEMSRQKRDHKTTSENHDKLAKKYKDSGKECDKLRDDIAKLRRENTKLRNDLSASEKTNHNLNGHLKIVEGDNRRLREENGKLEKGNAVLKGELNEEKLHTEYLDGQILERDKQIAKSHGDAVKNLTQTVSSSMTDNQIAKELTSFFDNCYEEWAMDHCVDHLEDTKEIEMHLLKGNLLLQDPAAPPEFQFDLEDSTALAIVLQTYLSQALCQAFFKSPYFLIALGGERPIKDETWDGRGLSRIEHWEGG
jgi:hypothetical protein